MKTKRLKTLKYNCIEGKGYEPTISIETLGDKYNEELGLTKREALALLKFLLGEMELTEKQWESIYNIARAKYFFLKETP